jgi:hypothetical protein
MLYSFLFSYKCHIKKKFNIMSLGSGISKSDNPYAYVYILIGPRSRLNSSKQWKMDDVGTRWHIVARV